ncbi:MAG: PucR family transcriptional regulator [Mobilitalea sp.]
MVSCRDIMNLDICTNLKLLGGGTGLDHPVSWPFIKNMDTISEWIHGGELIFVIGAKEDNSERGLLVLMEEASRNDIAGVVMLQGEDYIKSIPKSVIRFSDEHSLPLFKIPFRLKLIDITQEISRFIVNDREKNRGHEDFAEQSLFELMLSGKQEEDILAYCWMKLQPLTEADKVLKSEYVRTLQSYLKCNNDTLHTSKDMYIHRNTMINRLKKISALLDTNINAIEVRNEFYNIFKALEYYGQL